MAVLRSMTRSRLQYLCQHSLRRQSTYQPPDPPKANPHGNFYKQFGRPVAKNFLIAIATFQVLYIGWIKLEGIEIRHEKGEEMKGLQHELEGLTGKKAS
ncbi:hypothetical protein EJ03DRAFT_86251 [Teratosphaeria nubilosa]|uniref:Uncharacterized protein n=1 Tax=Teratosphaeria nubilosa TaxID=161662 RepID=A0A6G1LAJ8_9PEZI|nr:hypothetical protein EJ03DRAFT_86251 [Teratosphaeria nubilosa]